MAQPFLEAGKHCILASGLDIDDPARRQPYLRKGRGKQILPRDAP
jgi:hypothetical protein